MARQAPTEHVGQSISVVLADAHHIKKVPGRKTDVKDSEWLAQLLEHGLLRASFIPPRSPRELRDLTRQRTQLMGAKTVVADPIQKTLGACLGKKFAQLPVATVGLC